MLLYSVSLWGQSTFHKKFQGGSLHSITPLSSGGILGCGFQDFPHPVNNQGLLVRISDDGDVIWTKKYPSIGLISSAIETEDGFLIVGDSVNHMEPIPRPRYGIISKLMNNGDVVWSKILGIESTETIPRNVLKISDGYLVDGNFFTRLDGSGNTVWSKTYSTDNFNYFGKLSAKYIEGDTIYAIGHLLGNGCLIRINLNNGELINWSSFGGIYLEEFYSINPTQDGNFILAGITRSTTGSEESRPWIVKINRTGQIIWSKTYNLLGTSLICQMAESNDEGFVLSMGGDNAFTTTYAVLAKIDSLGNFVWAYNYAGGQQNGLGGIKATSDGGFVALGYASMLKTDDLGRVSNGCCPAPLQFQVENYTPPIQNPLLIAENWEHTVHFTMQGEEDTFFEVTDFCEVPLTSVVQQIQVCQGDSIQINGTYFQAPNTIRDTVQSVNGGCDTVHVYNLVQIPQPFRVETISFCPGNSVVVNGIAYTQPDTISQILPAISGCDTLLVSFLRWKTLPKKYETTTFCPGDTVFINGIGYQFPGTLPNPDTLPGSAIGCDTLLYQVLAYPSGFSSVLVHCPPDMTIITAPATPIVVNYSNPVATSDCICPDLNYVLVDGLPSGAAFPVGNTQVCYSVNDVCGDYEACCFEVKVEEEAVCDAKETGCIQYELLGISIDASQNKTYRIRVTNDCASALGYTAFQVPNGITALAPAQNSTYTSPNAIEYTVRNPNHSPFHSIRFKPVNSGLASGQSDVFEYTLPAQASPVFIKAATRLASGAFYEATLNTFGCSLQANVIADRTFNRPVFQPTLRVFPNPSSGELFLDLTGLENGIAEVRVLNAHGQEMAQTLLPTGQGVQFFPLAHSLTDGLYFLELKSENGERQTAKFVLHR